MKNVGRKHLWKRVCTCVLALMMLFSVLPMQAGAADVEVPESLVITLYSSKDVDTKKIEALTLVESGKVTSLKSTKTSVVKISKNTLEDGSTEILLTPKKAGTATVSFKVDGKKYTTAITVKKYVNPVSSITIGSTKLKASKFKTISSATLNYSDFKGKKVKVKVTLKSGWKLLSGYINVFYANSESTAIKNNKSVKIKGGAGCALLMRIQNKKTGQIELISVTLE
ncbi:MAG: hypothetical protein LIO94_07240 [Clostridiales bacterium]|nr:hypothetical protein [Clostridiales bacterium]